MKAAPVFVYTRQLRSSLLALMMCAGFAARAQSNSPAEFNSALGTTNLNWTTTATNGWFVESTNVFESASAAQSGVVTNTQSSALQITVTGPGTITFWWQTQTEMDDFDFDLVFSLDGGYEDDIDNIKPWVQDSFLIPAGTHVLAWTAYAGDFAYDAGWIDKVSYVPDPSSFSLLNPRISGTNFQFSFPSQSGFSSTVLYSTNAAGTNWQIYTNLAGDGTAKTIQVPIAGARGKFFRVLTQ